MKKFIRLLYIILIPLVLVNINCRQESPERAYYPVLPPVSPPPVQFPAPSGFSVNGNITVELPINFALLTGKTYGAEWEAAAFKWEKISGPASYTLGNRDTLRTKVNNLEKGLYQFTLTGTSALSYSTLSDTMTVSVRDATSIYNQVIFHDLIWECSFVACAITLSEILTFVPANSPFTVYVRRNPSAGWELVSPATTPHAGRFEYSIMNKDITVWDSYGEQSTYPDVKLVF